ncbi:MAG: HAMP domain-containing sensor histidine kinase, partial [Bacteroidota bacterium]
DLNSTIVATLGFAELLADPPSSLTPEEEREFLRKISSGGRKMSAIVRELLLFARMKKEDVEPLPLRMDGIIGEALRRLSHLVRERRGNVEVLPGLPEALGYAPWVEEVWFNLLGNALKYGGTPPRVRAGGEEKGGLARFSVEDNGAGIPAEDLTLILHGEIGERKRLIRGHGLGLTIARRIVEKLGGTLEAESTPGKGSVFFFTLPLAPPAGGTGGRRPPEAGPFGNRGGN